MELFQEYPLLEDELIILRKMGKEDIADLIQITENDAIYRYLPTFLYEKKYDDLNIVLERMDEECFFTKDSILLGIFLKENGKMVGIGEIYSYKPEKDKASIGYRLNVDYWGRGLATRTAMLLRNYIIEDVGLKKITGHVMKENIASAKVLRKCGFIDRFPDLWEDWGFDHPVLTDKYMYKKEYEK